MILRHLIAAALVLLPFIASGQPATSVSTLADLAAFPGRSNEVVRVRGFYSRDDWGKPRDYVWDPTSTAATNAVCVQRWASGSPIATGRWVHDWDGDVQVFGARGDDTTDDTLAIRAAVDMAKSRKLQIYVPAGTYKLTSTIDLRNSGDNAMEFGGIRGDGLTLTKFKAYHDDPVFQIQGRGGRYERFMVTYDSARDVTKTTANAVTFYGFVYYMTFREIEVTFGYRGLYSDAASPGIFSCSFDEIAVRNISYRHVDVQSSTGNRWGNLYLGNQGGFAADIMLNDRAGASAYQQVNFEHCNLRTSAIRIRGDAAQFQHLHFEGIRMLTDGPLVDVGGLAADISSMTMVNCYGAGHYLSSITTAGVATVNLLGQAVQGHGFQAGDSVTIIGATPTNYNGTFTISSVTSSNFTFSVPGSPGSDATPNYAAGSDWIWCYIGNYPAPALFVSSAYGNSKVHVGGLTMRNNKVQSYNSAGRNGWSWLLAREFGGKRIWVDIDYIIQGSQYRGGDNQLGFVPIVASSRTNNVTTAYFQYPHELQQGQYVSFSGGANLNFGTNYIQVADVPDRYSATFNATGANAGLTKESANLIPIRVRITSKSRTSNIATVETDAAHNFGVGARVLIRGMSDGTFSDSEATVLSVPSSTSFTYLSVGSNAGSSAETTGHVFEYSSGINAALQSTLTTGLVKADRYFRPLVCLASDVIDAGATSNYVFNVNGVRPRTPVEVLLAESPNASLRYMANVVSNDYINVGVHNAGASPITNAAALAWLLPKP